jgi:hypothetical protein
MHDLRLVGVHEDGEHLLLSAPDGEQYLLGVDETLRAAVRRDRAHLGQLQIQISGELRPREVQAQIRAGATAEDVADRSGWPLDRVRRYEGAVLAERAHIADLARSVTLRRRGTDTSPPTLAFRVEQRLAGRGAEMQQNVWDSYRAEDGPWMVTLRFAAGGREREARWLFDAATRTVTPQDDEALWLSEDEQPPAPPQAAPHLAAVPTVTAVSPRTSTEEDIYDVDAEGGLDEPASVTLDAPSAVDLVGAMRQRRHGRRRSTGATGPTAGEQAHLELEPLAYDPSLLGDPPAPHPFPFPERLRPAAETGAEASDHQSPEPPEELESPEDTASTPPAASNTPAPNRRSRRPMMPDARGSSRTEATPSPAAPERPRNFGPPQTPSSTAGPSRPVHGPTGETPGHRRARRASVPSWDEIMFGKRD